MPTPKSRVPSTLWHMLAALLLSLFFSYPAAAADIAKGSSPQPVKVGVFVTSLYDFKLVEKSYNAEFWVWFVFPDSTMKGYLPQDTTDIINAKSFKREFYYDEIRDGYRWVSVKYDALLIQNWDMTDFPFDRQTLRIDLEETDLEASALSFTPDQANSGIDSAIRSPGWEFADFSIESRTRHDETTYGDPTLTATSSYPQAIVTIALKRNGTRLLFNLLTAAYVAFILGIMVLFLHPDYVDSRKVLITSAMITIIGNHFAISATLPAVPTFTLIDEIMITTFVAICLIAAFSVITTHYVRKKKIQAALKINRAGRWSILIAFIAFNTFFYIRALT